jgi:CBS domain-containing protein
MPKKATKKTTQTVEDLMTRNPACLLETETVIDAAKLMDKKNIGDVIVLDDTAGRVKGIVTDRDIVIRALAHDQDPSRTVLSAVCSTDVVCVEPGASIDEVVELMRDKAIRRVPVVEDEKPVGILSLGDVAERLDKKSALADISSAPPQE